MGRRKVVEDHELLAVARTLFVKKGVTASTREIARRAGVSEAVIYQRHPTKARLFFAAMVPPALNVEDLLAAPANNLSVVKQLERIAVGMMRYFREVVPTLVQLVTHPEFDLGKFAERHPDSPFGRIHGGARPLSRVSARPREDRCRERRARCLDPVRRPAESRPPRTAGRARWKVR